MLQLRTPLDDLRRVDSSLAQRLEEVSISLDKAGTAAPTQSAEQAEQTQRRLAETWEILVSQARHIPDFQDFMRPLRISALARAAYSSAPVVINVHTTRCDALAFLPGSEAVIHIPLPDLTHQNIVQMRRDWDSAVQASTTAQRGIKVDRSQTADPRRNFLTVLRSLWVDVVQPILSHLNYLNESFEIDQLPRITWCLTGPLTFLPLHAAGIYGTIPPQKKLHDFIISSYTPNLGALLATPPSPEDFSGILAVGMTATPRKGYLHHTSEELDKIVRLAGSKRVTRLEGLRATIGAVRDGMNDHT
ncbi:hypothetical protein FRC12_007626 [Ceratobasidium sp. 428]|nr:hypothetical protein FRC12_007626 [Ceratobasidium sp. 428]